MQSTMQSSQTHAIVIGGSMAGLLTARVLSDFFDQVTIIERDKLPDAPDYRNGTPQGRHLHALLTRGQRIMEDYFPGFEDELAAYGSPRIHWAYNTRIITIGGPSPRFESQIYSNLTSRHTLEHIVRQRVRQIANVTFIEEAQVTRLEAEQACVTGVRIKSGRGHDEHMQTLRGHLVVDASGRRSNAPDWLRELGYDAPDETVVNGYLGYATRWYEAPDHADLEALAIQANTPAGHYRAGGIFRVDGNRWVVTLSGGNKDYPPTDEAGFDAFAASLNAPDLYNIIKEAKPISPIYGYRRTENRMRHYERLTRRPENFIVLGDAACAFNPVYGQGMSVAAMQTVELRDLLRQTADVRYLDGFAAHFQKRVATVVANPWQLATAEDLRYPSTDGDEPGVFVRWLRRYTDALAYAMAYDPAVVKGFVLVQNLEKSGASLLTNPRVVAGVFWQMLRKPFRPRQHRPTSAQRPIFATENAD